MNYGDTIKFIATDSQDTRRFILKRSKGVTSKGYKLYGYDPVRNDKNLLEDFGIDQSHPSRRQIIDKVESRIRFYIDGNWDLTVAPSA